MCGVLVMAKVVFICAITALYRIVVFVSELVIFFSMGAWMSFLFSESGFIDSAPGFICLDPCLTAHTPALA